MAIEKRWIAIAPRAFTADGAVDGSVNLTATYPFKVKQHIEINATGLPQLFLEVKRVVSATLLYVGPISGSIDTRTDLTAYTTALSANIAAHEQLRSKVPEEFIPRATYEEEPAVAVRTFAVDTQGNPFGANNPLPVTATFSGDVQVGDIRITAHDDDPVAGDIHSDVRINDGTTDLKINTDGSINANITGSATISGNVGINGLNVFQTTQYAVGTSAVQLTPTPLTNRSSMSIKVITTATNIVYVGTDAGVTTSTGYPLFNGDSIQLDLTGLQTIYAIATAAGQTVAVMEIA